MEKSENKKRANDGDRTRDIQLGKLALYQLSYSRLSLIVIRADAEINLRP